MVLVSQNYFEWDTDLPYFSLPLETKIKKRELCILIIVVKTPIKLKSA